MNARTRIAGLTALMTGLVFIACVDPTTPTGDGGGTATTVDSALVATAGAAHVALGDINGDGLTDVASVASESQPVQIHLRNATGGFDSYSIAGGAPLTKMADIELADMNLDGLLDVVVLVSDTGFVAPDGASVEGTFAILFQGADPTDANTWTQIPKPGVNPPANLSFAGNEAGVTDMEVDDVNGDGAPDILLLSNEPESTRTYLFANPGAALAASTQAWSRESIEQDASDMESMELSDLDNDGDLDVVMTVPAAKSFNTRWLQNPLMESGQLADAFPTFLKDQVDPLFEATAGAQAVKLADLNGDGTDDIASISAESQAVQVHLRDPDTGMFETTTIAGGGPLGQMVDLELADFNTDGKLDMCILVQDTGFAPPKQVGKCGQTVTPTMQGSLILLIQGAVTDEPNDWTQVEVFTYGTNEVGMVDSAVGDFTNDGLTDIAIISNEPFETDCAHKFVYTFTNPGAGNAADGAAWNATRQIADADAQNYVRIEAADLERDGDIDIILTSVETKTFSTRWLRNRVNGTVWDRVFISQQAGGGDFMTLGDVDQDGNMDIAVASIADQLVQWFRNPGPLDMTLDAMQKPWNVFNVGSVSGTISQIQLADLNQDGSLDMFVSASGGAVGFIQGDDVEQVWDGFTIFSQIDDTTVGRVAFNDFDGDGLLDFVAPLNREGILGDEFAIYLSFSGSHWVRRFIGQQSGGSNDVAVGDIDGDGFKDVAVVHKERGLAQWFRSPGTDGLKLTAQQLPWDTYTIFQFGEETQINDNDPGLPQTDQIKLADINADGRLDAFVIGSGTAFRMQPGTDVYSTWQSTPVFTTDPIAEIGGVGLLDSNGDGYLDYLVPLNRDGLTQDSIIIFPGP